MRQAPSESLHFDSGGVGRFRKPLGTREDRIPTLEYDRLLWREPFLPAAAGHSRHAHQQRRCGR